MQPFAVAALTRLVTSAAWPAPVPLTTPERRPSPPFTGKALPEPPQQKEPWTPPKTTLPESVVTATRALFDAGLADPRGGEYRVIEVGTGSCWSGDARTVRTHGWVFPAEKAQKQRFAVGWNGLVYPVVSVGREANLRADLRAVLQAAAHSPQEQPIRVVACPITVSAGRLGRLGSLAPSDPEAP
jgi:hypothetical protein